MELPELDQEFLNEKGFVYQLEEAAGGFYLILQDQDFPECYNPRTADILIELPAGYPGGQLDMFWTYPDIKLASGAWPQASDVHEIKAERNWQRWSRHISWRPGIDSLRTFIAAMKKEISLCK